MTLKELASKTKELIHEHPSSKEELLELYYLAVSEVEEGGSENHKCELALNSMYELINE